MLDRMAGAELRNEANFGCVMRGGLLGEPETKPTRPQKKRRILTPGIGGAEA